jgi:polyhydroxyalkanoate synthesis regulator phasin
MVRRFEPCHKYFDQWDEDGSPSCREARDGEYVLYDTYKTEHARLTAQIERLKKQVSSLTEALKEEKSKSLNKEALVNNCFE